MSELTREQIEETTRDLLSLFGVQNPRDIESRKRIIAIRKLALAALERGMEKNDSCPCAHTTPCRNNCTCVNPLSSAGCARCCSYGSDEQQQKNAERIAAALERGMEKNDSCPCAHTTPCRNNCTCVNPLSSAGCARCCSYGSDEQQQKNAERIAAALERGVWVSVSERLTDQTEVYITAFGNKGVWLSVFNIDKQRWFPCVAYDPTVTHWMPLPAAPVSYDELEFTTDQPISPATPQTDK
jgi:uncharacterized protein YoaH (UPF0181 family)